MFKFNRLLLVAIVSFSIGACSISNNGRYVNDLELDDQLAPGASVGFKFKVSNRVDIDTELFASSADGNQQYVRNARVREDEGYRNYQELVNQSYAVDGAIAKVGVSFRVLDNDKSTLEINPHLTLFSYEMDIDRGDFQYTKDDQSSLVGAKIQFTQKLFNDFALQAFVSTSVASDVELLGEWGVGGLYSVTDNVALRFGWRGWAYSNNVSDGASLLAGCPDETPDNYEARVACEYSEAKVALDASGPHAGLQFSF